MSYSNLFNIPLALQVWLVHDSYDYQKTDKYISATSLLKPIRQIVLSSRMESNKSSVDLSELIAARMGSTLHEGIEQAWIQNGKECLKKLGYPKKVIERIVINPEIVQEGQIPVYLEQRRTASFKGWNIGGKFDLILDGQIQDNKSTSVYTYMNNSRDTEYIIQGSIYRWLNQDRVTKDTMQINFIFTDWSKTEAERNSDYPKSRIATKTFNLLSVQETEAFISRVISQLDQCYENKEEDLPSCPEDDLWFPAPTYKYYLNPEKRTRATKTFDDYHEAVRYQMSEKNGRGIIITIKGKPRRCQYCPASSICSQYRQYFG